MTTPMRRMAGPLVRPVTNWLDRRLSAQDTKLDGLHAALGAWMNRSRESEEHLARTLVGLRSEVQTAAGQAAVSQDEVRAIRSEVGFLADELRALARDVRARVDPGAPAELASLDGPTADFLNRATGYRGLAAQAGIFVNEPVIVAYEEGAARVSDVNERILEVPFVFRESGRLAPGSAVLDVGSSESTVSLSLAGLGHRVTAVDPRGYAFAHPRVTEFHGRLEDYAEADAFDAAVLLSTIEHVGVEHYGQEAGDDSDIDLVAALRRLVKPGGFLFLTTPYGQARLAGFQRIYDHVRLGRLLDGWEIVRCEIAEQVSPTEWTVTDLELGPVADDVYRVAMVVARRPGEAGGTG